MKKIEAIIRPEKLDDVRSSLEKAGYPGITITEVEGHGLQKGITQQWRGDQYQVNVLPKIKLEIVSGDKEVEPIIQAIVQSAYTGGVGDGKVFVYDVIEAVRIRTRDRGQKALA